MEKVKKGGRRISHRSEVSKLDSYIMKRAVNYFYFGIVDI